MMQQRKLTTSYIICTPPLSRSLDSQSEAIDEAITYSANAILVAPNGSDATTLALERARAAGLKIIYVDSDDSVAAAKTFTTDNKNIGRTAGNEMIAALESQGSTKGMIGIISLSTDCIFTLDREVGFSEAFGDTAFEIIEPHYCEGSSDMAQKIAEELIKCDIVGIFGTFEEAAVGTGAAIKANGNKVVGIGCGLESSSDTLHALISDGALLCTIVCNPYEMGYQGMEAAIGVLDGTVTEDGEVIYTGAIILTKDDI